MALSFRSVEKAYTVLNQIKNECLPELVIRSWPEDIYKTGRDMDNPPVNILFGWDKKSDDGWENLFFFVENPSQELKDKFKELAVSVPNTFVCREHSTNSSLWKFGWF